ncbi:MAG: hypothetical protein ACOCQA_04020 [bacterium]
MLKKAKEICKVQGIEFKPRIMVTVICPRCSSKTLTIDQTEKGVCNCGYKADVFEILDLSEKEWEDKHRESINLMTKRGE